MSPRKNHKKEESNVSASVPKTSASIISKICNARKTDVSAASSSSLNLTESTNFKRKKEACSNDDEVVVEDRSSEVAVSSSSTTTAGTNMQSAKMRRILSNREHARASYLRKKKLIEDLKTNVTKLEDENKRLREENIALKANQINSMNYANAVASLTTSVPPPQGGTAGSSHLPLQAHQSDENKRLWEENIALKAGHINSINYANAMASIAGPLPHPQGASVGLSHMPLQAHQSLLLESFSASSPMLQPQNSFLASLAALQQSSAGNPTMPSNARCIAVGIPGGLPTLGATETVTGTDTVCASDYQRCLEESIRYGGGHMSPPSLSHLQATQQYALDRINASAGMPTPVHQILETSQREQLSPEDARRGQNWGADDALRRVSDF